MTTVRWIKPNQLPRYQTCTGDILFHFIITQKSEKANVSPGCVDQIKYINRCGKYSRQKKSASQSSYVELSSDRLEHIAITMRHSSELSMDVIKDWQSQMNRQAKSQILQIQATGPTIDSMHQDCKRNGRRISSCVTQPWAAFWMAIISEDT